MGLKFQMIHRVSELPGGVNVVPAEGAAVQATIPLSNVSEAAPLGDISMGASVVAEQGAFEEPVAKRQKKNSKFPVSSR